jgi:hypothetical protein
MLIGPRRDRDMTTHDSPWVLLFSRFTSEALLFEALIIFTLLAIYSGFFVLRKRRFGSIQTQIPAGVVKAYLNELIVDAEALRAQLFGLLSSAGVPAHEITQKMSELQSTSGAAFFQATPQPAGSSASSTPAASSAAIQAMEAKITEQAKQIENYLAEKTRVEKELSEVRAQGAATPTGDTQGVNKLQEKIGLLEGKLAEYSVIEDDLANLKRLQQENAQLKTALGNKGAVTEAPAEPVAAASVAAAPAAPAESKTVLEPAATPPSASADAGLDDALSALTVAAKAPEPAAPADFEGLVDQVEKSLEPAAAAETPSTSEAATATIEKSDADLVAEFEKMLNS